MNRVTALAMALIAGLTSATAEESAPARCNIDMRAAPAKSGYVTASVRGLATVDEVREQTASATASTRAQLSPAYASLPRIYAVFIVNGVRHGTIAAVTDGHVPAPGSVVTLASRRRDPNMPCHFIPWIVVPGDMV